eukprot:TRINITY_DN1325_c0_g1_i2.p1 TRINITY_DN1325_c0_g1~~TRINITY_DN1325_c0_g1_i2.p1  ORF type:complete len:259 (-),score=36.20 TRINITY_DN1325_c0_g1_i2:190-966(-)
MRRGITEAELSPKASQTVTREKFVRCQVSAENILYLVEEIKRRIGRHLRTDLGLDETFSALENEISSFRQNLEQEHRSLGTTSFGVTSPNRSSDHQKSAWRFSRNQISSHEQLSDSSDEPPPFFETEEVQEMVETYKRSIDEMCKRTKAIRESLTRNRQLPLAASFGRLENTETTTLRQITNSPDSTFQLRRPKANTRNMKPSNLKPRKEPTTMTYETESSAKDVLKRFRKQRISDDIAKIDGEIETLASALNRYLLT